MHVFEGEKAAAGLEDDRAIVIYILLVNIFLKWN
jgi:hypothetical protein